MAKSLPRALAGAMIAGPFLLAGAAPASGGFIDEVRGGVSFQSTGPIAENVEDGVAIAGEVLFKSPAFLRIIGAPRPHIGGSAATDANATSFVYAGLAWEVDIARRIYLHGGAGGAVHDGRTTFNPAVDLPRRGEAFLGCSALFRLHGGAGYRLTERLNVNVTFEHLSNAGICSENEGLENVGVRLGYRF